MSHHMITSVTFEVQGANHAALREAIGDAIADFWGEGAPEPTRIETEVRPCTVALNGEITLWSAYAQVVWETMQPQRKPAVF